MNPCRFCHRDGLYFVEHENPDGYVVLACTCIRGERWRVKHQLRAFCAGLQPPPLWFGRLEEFFTKQELAAMTTIEREHTVIDGKEHVVIQQPETRT